MKTRLEKGSDVTDGRRELSIASVTIANIYTHSQTAWSREYARIEFISAPSE